MRRFRQRRLIGFRREQIESAINLERIRADDFRVELLRDFRGDLGFSRRGGSDDEEGAFHLMLLNVGGAFAPRLVAAQRRLPHSKQKTGRLAANATSSPGFAKRQIVSSAE